MLLYFSPEWPPRGILFGQDFTPVNDKYMKKAFKFLATLRNSGVIFSKIAEYNISVCMHG